MGLGPPTQQRAPKANSGGTGGPPITPARDPPRDKSQDREAKEGAPQPQQRAQTARGQDGAGDKLRATTASEATQDCEEDPPERQCALPAHGMPKREGGDSSS